MHRRSILVAAVAMAAAAPVAYAQAPSTGPGQGWPAKPITYIVPFGAGGTTDVLARMIAQKAGDQTANIKMD